MTVLKNFLFGLIQITELQATSVTHCSRSCASGRSWLCCGPGKHMNDGCSGGRQLTSCTPTQFISDFNKQLECHCILSSLE